MKVPTQSEKCSNLHSQLTGDVEGRILLNQRRPNVRGEFEKTRYRTFRFRMCGYEVEIFLQQSSRRA